MDFIRALKFNRKFKNIWEIPLFRFMQFWGTFKGCNYKKPITKELIRYFYYPRPVSRFRRKT
jgi:hypothetical protein